MKLNIYFSFNSLFPDTRPTCCDIAYVYTLQDLETVFPIYASVKFRIYYIALDQILFSSERFVAKLLGLSLVYGAVSLFFINC